MKMRHAFMFAALSLCATAAHAQSLGIAPGEIREGIKGGEPIRFELTVANDGDTPVVMHASVQDLWYNDKNEKTFDPPGTHPRSAANWLEFVPRDFTVPAHGSGKVNVVVTPPAVVSGGYYAVLFVESKPALAQAATAQSQAVFTSLRLGAIVLLNAVGTETYAINVSDATLVPPGPDQPLSLKFKLTNQSNSHIFPQAKLAILKANRQVVARTENQPKRFFPDQKDEVTLSWAGTLPPGDYLAILSIIYGDNKIDTREFPFTVR